MRPETSKVSIDITVDIKSSSRLEDYIHTAKFRDKHSRDVSGNVPRISFMFRWLSKTHDFYTNESGTLRNALVPTAEIVARAKMREQDRLKKKKKKKKKERSVKQFVLSSH